MSTESARLRSLYDELYLKAEVAEVKADEEKIEKKKGRGSIKKSKSKKK